MKRNWIKNLTAALLGIALLSFGLGTARALNITDGLVAYWPLNGTNADGTTSDQTSFTNTLYTAGGPTVVAGQVGNALSLNGTSQYLVITNTFNFNDAAGLPIYGAPSGYSVAMWVKAPPVGTGGNVNDHYLFAEASTTNNNPFLLFQTRNAADVTPADTNKLSIAIRTLGGTTILNQVKSTSVVFDNNWHHIAWVDARGSAKLYVDGNLDGGNFNYTYAAFPMNNTSIGALIRNAVGSPFKAAVDEVAIWERPLSQSEVQSVFTSGIPTPIPAQAPVFILSPVSRTNSMGDRATFSSGAVGLHPLFYQWYKDGVLLPSQTSATAVATDLTAAATNTYMVIVTNSLGAATNTATLVVLPDAAPNPASGLISYWPFDIVNTSPTTNTPDLYYSHTDLSLKFMDVTNLATGVYSNGLAFNGVNQYGQRVGGTPVFTRTNYSVAFWINGPPGQVNKILYGEGDTSSGNFFLFGTENNTPATGLLNLKASPIATFSDKKSTRTVFDNTWHHVCWADENGKAELYVDGVLDETDYTYNRTSNLVVSITAIGALVRATPSLYFTGFMDEVGTWSRRLSYTEIQQIRTNGIPPPALTVPSISQQPASSTNALGDRVTLSVLATGSAPLSYQWLLNGVAISGQTNSSLVLLLTASATNNYSVIITNQASGITSTVAQVSYLPDPAANVRAGLLNYWPLDVVTDPPTNSSPDLYSADDLSLTAMDNTSLTAGQFGQALSFNGGGQYGLRVGGYPIYLTTNYAVSMWVNGSPGQLNKMIYGEGGAGGNFFLLGTESSAPDGGLLNVKASPGMSDRKSTRVVFDNTWHHVVWVDRNGKGKLYVDGVMDETDYTYTRTNLALESTTIGALTRGSTALFFTGLIDEVGVWNRGLSWTEIGQIHASSIPAPLAPIAPVVFRQPTDVTNLVFAGDTVSFSVLANGTSPLSYQWRQGGTNVDGVSNPSALTSVLTFSSVQTNDAGFYTVVITNVAGAVTSSVAQLAVIPYTAVTSGLTLSLDFDLAGTPNVQPGFTGMTLGMSGTNFSGVTVTITPIGNTVLADRNRNGAVVDNPPALTEARIYNDFIFANNSTNGNGMRFLITRLAPNTTFGLTIWSFDTASVGARVSDWTEALSGQPIISGYTFNGSILPTNDGDDTFGALLTSSATGRLQIEGRNSASVLGVLVNALQLVANPVIQITSARVVADGNLQLTVETQYPGEPILFQESPDLSPGSWQNATDGTITQTHGPVVTAEFPLSATAMFYRVMKQ